MLRQKIILAHRHTSLKKHALLPKLKRTAHRAAARGQPLSDPHGSRAALVGPARIAGAAAMGDSSMSASELRNRYHQGGSAGDADLSASQLRARYGIASNRAGM